MYTLLYVESFAVANEAELIRQVVDLCKTFEENGSKPVDLFYAFRCMTMDIITCTLHPSSLYKHEY
jgi:hypothetical protein